MEESKKSTDPGFFRTGVLAILGTLALIVVLKIVASQYDEQRPGRGKGGEASAQKPENAVEAGKAGKAVAAGKAPGEAAESPAAPDIAAKPTRSGTQDERSSLPGKAAQTEEGKNVSTK
jgi:hypothetical protein